MSLDTVVLQGRFTSDGSAKTLVLRSDVDWVNVYNYTQASTQQQTGRGVQFYWQRGMAADTGIEYKKTNTTDALNMVTLASGGFTLIDSSSQQPGPLRALTSISAANPPRALVATTAGLNAGDVVRLVNVAGGLQVSGIDFTIGNLDATHFDLSFMQPIAAAGGPGFYRQIPFEPYFYPRNRTISNITQAAQAVIQMTVTHGFTVGQAVRLVVPAICGMTQMNGLIGNIVAINLGTNTITVDIDSSAFTAFVFPITTDVACDFAQVVPVGEDTAVALAFNQDILADATRNTAVLGIKLAAGAQSPAGSASDVIYWQAGRSFSVDNQ